MQLDIPSQGVECISIYAKIFAILKLSHLGHSRVASPRVVLRHVASHRVASRRVTLRCVTSRQTRFRFKTMQRGSGRFVKFDRYDKTVFDAVDRRMEMIFRQDVRPARDAAV